MEQLNRRQRAQRDKQRRIIQAAAELFRTQGFDATTTGQIAAHADVAKGTLFLYAPTKLRLLALVYEQDLERLVAQALADVQPDAPVVASLTGIFLPFFQLYEQDVALARRFVREQLFVEQSVGESGGALRALLSGLVRLIQSWQAAGRVARDVDALLAAQNSFALYFAVLVAWLSGRLPLQQRDAQLHASLTLYWRGLLMGA